ncbi:hypothetical protein [Rhodanobacter sp. DHB23]|uniref:hypothetical protein n=1 Tax=Rhodanobacter sp. DHB23 TaxID=2775923 RepID=UPI00177B36F4|nr:hypothetical protein [Rhodanobacter sp. DHB23]MBD8874057.1 hypothetical protein [Rhodanobacter sp. DHB23]
MKTLTACAVAALAVSGIASVHAANAGKTLVTIDYTDIIAPAEMQAYVAGIKAYTRCLREHGVTFSEYAVSHETGRNTYEISFEREPMTWAQRDELGSESRPCKAVFNAQVDPHLESESGAVMTEEPELSHLPADAKNQAPPQFLHVFNYTLKSGPAAHATFADAVKKIAAAAARTKWPYYWNVVAVEGGGEGAPDYQLAFGGKDWAGVAAEPEPSLWKIVANAYGQSEAGAIRKSLDNAIAKIFDHFDRYNAELSYIAGINSNGPVSRISGTPVGQ